MCKFSLVPWKYGLYGKGEEDKGVIKGVKGYPV
jgi:hypothetical protein